MKCFVFILLIFIGFNALAQQQGLLMDVEDVDSTEIQLQKQIEYFQLVNGSLQNNMIPNFKLPKFELGHAPASSLTLKPQQNFTSLSLSNNWVSPYYRNAEVLSSSVHNLGDKFVLGGYSYGANSVFSAPLPNQNSSYFDSYGSTMFIQYKVSKNIKIEAGVSVQQGSTFP